MTDYIFNFTDPLKGNFVVKPYTANGNKFPTTSKLASTATGASTPLLLYGKGHPEYGERVQENVLVVAENFSGAAPPIINSSGNTRNNGAIVPGIALSYYEAIITPTPPGSPLGSPIPLTGSPAFTVATALHGDTANAVVFSIAPSTSPVEILEFVRI